MGHASSSRAAQRRSSGFALIIVLWTLVLIAFITAALAATGRIQLRIAGNLAANAVTNAAADGAVSRAIFQLLDPNPKRRWPRDGAAHALTIGDCRITVRVYGEAGRINPNLARPALLAALLRVTGSDPATARRVAAAIGEWVGKAGSARTQHAMVAEYRDAGRDYAPPGTPLETIGELRRVLGMTSTVFARIAPHLSLFAPAIPVAADADPIVAAAIASITKKGITKNGLGGNHPPVVRSDNVPVRIEVAANGPGNARATAVVIARIVPASGSYAILAWHSGDDAD